MLKIKNGRIYMNLTPLTVSVKIPEDFWFVAYPESGSPNDIVFRTPDERALVEILVGCKEFDNTAEELLDEMEGCPKENLEGPYPISVNGMNGHYLFCANDIAQYVVMLDVEQFGLKCEDPVRHAKIMNIDRIEFTVSVSSEEGEKAKKEIHAAAEIPEISDLLNSIRVE